MQCSIDFQPFLIIHLVHFCVFLPHPMKLAKVRRPLWSVERVGVPSSSVQSPSKALEDWGLEEQLASAVRGREEAEAETLSPSMKILGVVGLAATAFGGAVASGAEF